MTLVARNRLYIGIAILLYVVIISGVIAGLFHLRKSVLANQSTPAAQEEWRAWREDVIRHQDDPEAAVARRVPKSTEPPALVLMRDYFTTCLVGSVIFVSLLCAATSWLFIGALSPAKEVI